MQNLSEALRLGARTRDARALNLLNDCAQVVEFDANSEWYATQDDIDGAKEILESQKAYVDSVLRMRTHMASVDVMSRALEMSLDHAGRSSVSQYLVDRIRDRGARTVSGALVQALNHDSSRLVRVAAATAIAEARPENFNAATGSQVVDVLTGAVLQSGIRTAVKATGSQDNTNRLDALLRSSNIESNFRAESVADAIHIITRTPPDLVLLDDQLSLGIDSRDGANAPISVFIQQVRRDYRTAGVPIVVMVGPAKIEKAREIHADEDNKVWVVPSNIGDTDFQRAIASIFDGADDAKARAVALAGDAAKALAALAETRDASFPVASAVDDLAGALSGRPDSVRIPTLRAIGAVGSGAASVLPALAATFADENNSTGVREGAMSAIAKILADGSAGRVEGLVANTILDGTRSGDLALRRASWMAFGGAQWSDDDFLALLDATETDGSGAAGGDAGLVDDVDLGDDDDDLGDDDDDDDDLGDDDDDDLGDDDDDDDDDDFDDF